MTGYDAMARVLKAEGVEFLVAFSHQTLIEACSEGGDYPYYLSSGARWCQYGRWF